MFENCSNRNRPRRTSGRQRSTTFGHTARHPRHRWRAVLVGRATLLLLVLAALAAASPGPAHADPGPCGGTCVTPPKPPPPPPPNDPRRCADCNSGATKPNQRYVTVYRNTRAYSTPYLDALKSKPLPAAIYPATCEAISGSRGRHSNPWWSRLRDGYWVNNGDLKGPAKIGIGDCAAVPPNDGVRKPRDGRQGCDGCKAPAPPPPRGGRQGCDDCSTPPRCFSNLSPSTPNLTPEQRVVGVSHVFSCASAPFERVVIHMQRRSWNRWETLTTRELSRSMLRPYDRVIRRDAEPFLCVGQRSLYTYRVRMLGYRHGRLVTDKASRGRRIVCPTGMAEGIDYWTTIVTVDTPIGISVPVPAGQLYHRISGNVPYVGSDYANFIAIPPERVCNWRIDFVYLAGGVEYERNRGNTHKICERFGEQHSFPDVKKRFGDACAELYADERLVARQCHPIALRAW